MIRIFLMTLIAACFTAPALAQDSLVRHFNTTIFKGVLEEAATDLGDTIVVTTDITDSGTPIVTAVLNGSINFGIIGTACGDDGKCVGANMMTMVTADSSCIGLDEVNTLNYDYAFTKYLIMDGDQVTMTRYLVLDYGQHRDNLVVEATNYISLEKSLMKQAGSCP